MIIHHHGDVVHSDMMLYVLTYIDVVAHCDKPDQVVSILKNRGSRYNKYVSRSVQDEDGQAPWLYMYIQWAIVVIRRTLYQQVRAGCRVAFKDAADVG